MWTWSISLPVDTDQKSSVFFHLKQFNTRKRLWPVCLLVPQGGSWVDFDPFPPSQCFIMYLMSLGYLCNPLSTLKWGGEKGVPDTSCMVIDAIGVSGRPFHSKPKKGKYFTQNTGRLNTFLKNKQRWMRSSRAHLKDEGYSKPLGKHAFTSEGLGTVFFRDYILKLRILFST